MIRKFGSDKNMKNRHNDCTRYFDYHVDCLVDYNVDDIADNCHNRRWCTFFKPVYFLAYRMRIFGLFWPVWAILSQIYALRCVLFTDLNSAVVYQNWQISGMVDDHVATMLTTMLITKLTTHVDFILHCCGNLKQYQAIIGKISKTSFTDSMTFQYGSRRC